MLPQVFTTFILLGDMFGLGTLTLPADFARLGWAVALPVIGLCALGMLYSGVLFGRLATHLPSTRAFDQLGSAAFGAHGKRMVYATVYLTILFEPVIFHLTCMESLQQMLFSASVSQIAAGSIVAFIIFPLGLVQGIEEVSAVAVLGTVGMLLAVITATYKLWSLEHIDLTPTELVHHGQFNTTLVAIMDLVSQLTDICTMPRSLLCKTCLPHNNPHVHALTTWQLTFRTPTCFQVWYVCSWHVH